MTQKRVALYARVSTAEQKNHGYSIEAQREELRKYVQNKDYEVIDEYLDEGFSGGMIKRPGLQRLLADIRMDKIDIVIFVKLDRWFRSVSQYYKIQEILDAHHVDWICTQEEYETLTSSGKFKVNIMLSVSQQFKDATSERIKSVFKYKTNNHYYVGRCVPIGFKLVREQGGNRVVIDEEQEIMIRELLNIYKECHSMRKAMKIINEKYNANITRKKFETLLESPLLHGQYKDDMNFLTGYINIDEHHELEEIRIRSRNNRCLEHYTYLFSGLIACPCCGRNLAGQRHRPKGRNDYVYPSYHCNYAKENCCYKTYIFESVVEKELLKVMKNKMKSFDCENRVDINIEERKIELNDALNRLNTLYVRGNIKDDYYEREYNIIMNELKSLEDNAEDESYQLFKTFCDLNYEKYYKKLTNEEKQSLNKKLIKKVRIDNNKVEFEFMKELM